MKNATVESLIAAALIAPSATFAQSAVFDFPTFYPEFTGQSAQPATKLDINSTSDTTPAPNKTNDKKINGVFMTSANAPVTPRLPGLFYTIRPSSK